MHFYSRRVRSQAIGPYFIVLDKYTLSDDSKTSSLAWNSVEPKTHYKHSWLQCLEAKEWIIYLRYLYDPFQGIKINFCGHLYRLTKMTAGNAN